MIEGVIKGHCTGMAKHIGSQNPLLNAATPFLQARLGIGDELRFELKPQVLFLTANLCVQLC